MIHYLDNSATTMVLPEAAEAAVHMMRETFGNPSSLHSMGIDAARVLKESRETAASALGCASLRSKGSVLSSSISAASKYRSSFS